MSIEPMWVDQRHGKEQIVAIEYHRGPGSVNHRFVPHSVTTAFGGLGGSAQWYDFEVTLDLGLRWHNSGGGGGAFNTLSISKYCKPKPPPARLWLAEGMRLTRTLKRGTKYVEVPATDADALKGGTIIITSPILMPIEYTKAKSRNPFDVSDESCGGFVWCDKCRGFYDDASNAPCDHMNWCDECCCFVNEQHVREDSHDGKPSSHVEPTA